MEASAGSLAGPGRYKCKCVFILFYVVKWRAKNEEMFTGRHNAAQKVLAEWMQKIRQDHFNPTKNTRVCSRHFKKTDFSVTVGGLRKLKKGSVPVYFAWNGYKLPAPRQRVWERHSESEMETKIAPDHDYCIVPQTGARASNLADENEALLRQVKELQQQLKVLKLRQRSGIERLSASDEDIRFYTRFV
uniref:THAP-type domain-containing protein n=1 Tax=Acanthochromis polyacanthus TaxID=80966 RepID=A0A3Q1GAP5_9TELE